MKKTLNKKVTTVQREHSALAALASVYAEGLTPTIATKRRLNLYVKGKLDSNQLLAQTLKDIKERTKQPVS